jgi:hypothetical protein
MSCVGMKRGAGDFELVSPVKRMRQYLQEGYMEYGQNWAEQEFAAGEFPSSQWADVDRREGGCQVCRGTAIPRRAIMWRVAESERMDGI